MSPSDASPTTPAPPATVAATGFGTPGAAWIAERTWDDAAEDEWSHFIAHLGTAPAKCVATHLDQLLRNPTANSLHGPEDDGLHLFADCADVPLVLRAYFAWKTRRPFQWVSAIHGERYSAGN